MSDSKVFKIQKRYIPGLAGWLNEQSLFGSDSRHRTRFVALLIEEMKAIDKERIEIVTKYADKEEDGKTLKKAVDNNIETFVVPDGKKKSMNDDYNELMNEELIIDIAEGNRSKIKAARDIVLNTKYEFGPKQTDTDADKIVKIQLSNDYEKWCEAFESLDL